MSNYTSNLYPFSELTAMKSSANATLQRHVAEHQKYARTLEEELKKKDFLIEQGQVEIIKAKGKTRQLEREKNKKKLDRCKQVESRLQPQTERCLVMRDLIDAGCSVKAPGTESEIRTPSIGATHRVSHPKIVGTPLSLRGPAVSSRKRCSRSVDKEWLNHRPENLLELDTIFQPNLCGGKSITKLVDSKSVTDRKVLKYSLTTQEFSAGEVATTIYKGDVLATKGGGAQVVYQDVEVLRVGSYSAVKRQ